MVFDELFPNISERSMYTSQLLQVDYNPNSSHEVGPCHMFPETAGICRIKWDSAI
jgi:hypothetical protein